MVLRKVNLVGELGELRETLVAKGQDHVYYGDNELYVADVNDSTVFRKVDPILRDMDLETFVIEKEAADQYVAMWNKSSKRLDANNPVFPPPSSDLNVIDEYRRNLWVLAVMYDVVRKRKR